MASGKQITAKHYAYRLDHDRGFAPHVTEEVCTLCGCKCTTVEAWARPGSWVVGIGGNGTGKPNLLIYAMQVGSNPTVAELRRNSPRLTDYLRGHHIKGSCRILVSRHFYYFGDHAIPLRSQELQGLIIRGRGCKKLNDEEIAQLTDYLKRNYKSGVHGCPNNPAQQVPARGGCLRVVSNPVSGADCA
jgi:hypothetical protein